MAAGLVARSRPPKARPCGRSTLLSAFGISISDAFAKKATKRGALDPRVLLARCILSAPFLPPFLAAGIPELDRAFWLLHPVWIPLETPAMYLNIHAIRGSPLSLTLPFLSLTSVFLIFTGWLFFASRSAGSA